MKVIQREAIKFLYPDVNPDAPIEELRQIPKLHLDKICGDIENPDYFTHEGMTVTVTAASFLVELFAVQPAKYIAVFEKAFLIEPTIYTLWLPTPVPVLFAMKDDNVVLKFADVTNLSQDDAVAQVTTALTVLRSHKIGVAEFLDVDIEGFEIRTQRDFGKKWNCAVLKTSDIQTVGGTEDAPQYSRTFRFLMTLSKDEKIAQRMESACERMFYPIRVRECVGCHRQFSDETAQGACTVPVHEIPDRIPFPDGSYEKTLPNGVVVENWECCGEQPKYSAGCVDEIIDDVHILDPETDSRWRWLVGTVDDLVHI